MPQHHATTLFEDNQGALMMATAQKPTRRTKHMDTRHFALQDWVDKDLITMKRITTSDNYADAMTKALPRTLFHRHMDYIQGKYIPQYAKRITNWNSTSTYDTIPVTPSIKALAMRNIQTDCAPSHGSEQGGKLY